MVVICTLCWPLTMIKGSKTLIEAAPQGNYLISAINSYKYTTFEIYELKKCKRVYSFGETKGWITDISCNQRTNQIALLSTKHDVAYHLFDCHEFQVLKKARQNPLQRGFIKSLDLNWSGERIATLDRDGVCLVSETATDACMFHQIMPESGVNNKCRWNPVSASSVLAVSFGDAKMDLFDVEKKSSLQKEAIAIGDSRIEWIDWRKDGSLIASAGYSKNVKIYDIREGKVVMTIFNLHSGSIYSVRWSPCGSLLATSSYDGTVSILDFKESEVLYNGDTADSNEASAVCFI